jgi:hypothetical protein
MKETLENINEGFDSVIIMSGLYSQGNEDLNKLIITAQKTGKIRLQWAKNILYKIREWQKR